MEESDGRERGEGREGESLEENQRERERGCLTSGRVSDGCLVSRTRFEDLMKSLTRVAA